MSKKQLISAAAVLAFAGSTGLTTALSSQSIAESYTTNTNSIATTSEELNLKDETIYVFANADGSTRKILSSDWSKNIEGTDVYTKFNEEKSAPLGLNITYKLDGKELSASEIAGKSGKVTVSYEFTNTEKEDGYFVPYAVISGLMLNNNHFKNVEVKNAKLMNDGSRTIIAALSLPGMQENLGVSRSQFEIPSSFEFTADATNFQLDMTVSIATSEVFSELDTSSLEATTASLESSLGELNSAMSQLISGSEQLYNGLDTLYVKVSGDLASSINKLATGSTELATGANLLATGLAEGQTTLTDLSAAINAGLDQIINGTLAHINPAINITNYSEYADDLAGDPATAGIKTVIDYLMNFRTSLQAYTAGVNERVAEAAVGAAKLNAGAAQLNEGLNALNAKTPELTDGVASLRDGAYQMNSGLNTFNGQGVQKLISVYNGSVKDLVYRLKDIANLSKNHTKTKYVYRVNEVK